MNGISIHFLCEPAGIHAESGVEHLGKNNQFGFLTNAQDFFFQHFQILLFIFPM